MAGAETISGKMVAQSRLKYEVEREEAALSSRIDMLTQYQALLAAS